MQIAVDNLIHNAIDNIPGFTDYPELLALYLLVKSVSKLSGDILEVGSWCGRSSVILAEASNSKVFCVDLFPLLTDWQQSVTGTWSIGTTAYAEDFRIYNETFVRRFKPVYELDSDVFNTFNKNTKQYRDIIVPLKGTLEEFELPKMKLAFIDGDHCYQGVIKDIEKVIQLMIPGGIICIDDVRDDFAGVTRAVNEKIISSGNFTDIMKLTRKLLVCRLL